MNDNTMLLPMNTGINQNNQTYKRRLQDRTGRENHAHSSDPVHFFKESTAHYLLST
jgi:hypothetical protein